MEIICPYCNKKADVPSGYVNRAKRLGVPRYCSKKCSGLARRINRTDEEKKKIKSDYDKQYRQKNYWWLAFQGAFQFVFDYQSNPEKYKQWRRKRQSRHNEYCRRPEYKKWKKEYDRRYKMQQKHGEYWEAASILCQLKKVIPSKQVKYNQGLINKTQKRKRKWQNRKQPSMPRI